MTWKVTITFPERPILGDVLRLATAQSIVMEEVLYQPMGDARSRHTPPQPVRHSGYVNRELKPTGSMPTFEKPKPDGIVTQEEIDSADLEGYTAYLEGTAPDAKSPYPHDGLLDKSWQNGFARAEHSDDRDEEGL